METIIFGTRASIRDHRAGGPEVRLFVAHEPVDGGQDELQAPPIGLVISIRHGGGQECGELFLRARAEFKTAPGFRIFVGLRPGESPTEVG